MMKTVLLSGLALAAATLALPGLAHAAAFKAASECKIGRHVADSQNNKGVVTQLEPNGGVLCTVKLDGGRETTYIFWMLHDAGGSAETDDKLTAGTYQCFSFSGGHINYDFMDVIITSPTSYRSGNATGKLSVDPKSKAITFASGPLKGQKAKLTDGPSIQFAATTCQRKK